jgi:glycosyltransferase involved in cell wall biosynthesis
VKISSYTTTMNCAAMGYPFIESIKSMLAFSDEVVIVDGGSTDKTCDILSILSASDGRVMVYENPVDLSDPRFATKADGLQKAYSRKLCKHDVLVQFDVDEVVHEDDIAAMRDCCEYVYDFSSDSVFALPLIEYWGSRGRIRCDTQMFKPRISRSTAHITHGLPSNSISIDKNGEVFSKFSDSCDYISESDGTLAGVNAMFLNVLTEICRDRYLRGQISKHDFLKFLKKLNVSHARRIPVIRHYSWFGMRRKIENYKSYWGKFWSSLFDSDVGEQNMFFQKPWSDVSDEEIRAMAKRLTNETAGWIFHSPIDFETASKYPFVTDMEAGFMHPSVMEDWIEKNRNYDG